MQKKYFFFFLLCIFFDQFSKYLIRVQGGFYICNKNLAFGINFYYLFIIILILSIFFILFLCKNKTFNPFRLYQKIIHFTSNNLLKKISVIFILSGGISNILDRFLFGCVIDFINLKIWPVFNLADIFITIGAIILIIKLNDTDQ